MVSHAQRSADRDLSPGPLSGDPSPNPGRAARPVARAHRPHRRRGARRRRQRRALRPEPSHSAAVPRARRLKPAIFKRSAFFHALARDPAITSILTQLLGPAIRQHGGKLNMKSAGYGSPVEWHQDWAFYPHTNDDVLATGIYLDDCDVDNGPLMVLPGTHRGPTFDHHADGRFCGAMNPADCDLDFTKAVPLLGPPGSMTTHHLRLVTGPALNRSNPPPRLLLPVSTAAYAR